MITVAENLDPGRSSDSPLERLSDETLLLQYAKTFDSQRFEVLVRRHEKPLYDYLCRYSGDAELSCDALQGTWLQLHLKCHMFTAGRSLRPWLYTIAMNQMIDALRSRRKHRVLSIDTDGGDWRADGGRLSDCLPSLEENSADVLQRQELAQDVRRAVKQLPEHQRELVELIFFGGFKYHEAAAELSIPEGTAKSRMHAAFHNLQPQLSNVTR